MTMTTALLAITTGIWLAIGAMLYLLFGGDPR